MSIAGKIGFPILLMTLGGFIAYGTFYIFLSRTRSDSGLVEAAAMEAVRAEQVGRLAYSVVQGFEWAREPLEESVRRFDDGLRLIENGGETRWGEQDPAPAEVEGSLREVRETWSEVRVMALEIVQLPPADPSGEESYLRMRPLLPKLTGHTEALVLESRERTERLRRRMQLTLGVICLADVLLMFLGGWLIRRKVLQPLHVVEAAALRVKDGDFSKPVPVLARDELGRLASAFNEMAGSLRSLLDREEKTQASLRALSGKLLRVQDDERRRIARELHDSTVQTIAAASMRLRDVGVGALSEDDRAGLEDSRELLNQATNELRTLSYLLHPPLLEGLGLVAALEDYVSGFSRRSGIQVELEAPGDLERLESEIELALFRVAQEALANVQKHARADRARIVLKAAGNELKLEISDRGAGVAREQLSRLTNGQGAGVGLAGMRERLRLLGGEFEVVSEGEGTRIRARLPRRSR